MSQETQQKPRTQSRQDSPSQNGGQEKARGAQPQKKGTTETRAPRARGNGDKGDRRQGSGSRGGRTDRPGPTKDSKTIYVGKVFTDDLDGSTIAEKLKEQRIKYLRDVLEQYGPIESFDAQLNDAYALVTFETHKAAEDALKALRNREEVELILERVESKILQNKLPTAVVPNLLRYKYSWSDKQSPSRTRSAGAKGTSGPKNVVAKKTTDQVASPTTVQPAQPQTQPQAKPKKERKPKQEEQPEPVQQQPKQKKTQQQAVQQQVSVLSPKTQGADDLQREAERARLTQDLIYLRQQQQHVSQELSAESDRCRARDERINRLSEELSRVRQSEQFLESQLKAEQNWKQAAEDRIVKLTEEVNHFVQEQKQVEKRLTTVSQQLNAAQNGQ